MSSLWASLIIRHGAAREEILRFWFCIICGERESERKEEASSDASRKEAGKSDER